MTENVYPELFDQVVRVRQADYRSYYNVASVEKGRYVDYLPDRNLYVIEEFATGYDTGYPREKILFEDGDTYPFLIREIEEWLNEKGYHDEIVTDLNSVHKGGKIMRLYSYNGTFAVKYDLLTIVKSYRYPCMYQIKDIFGNLIKEDTDLNVVLAGYYLFNEEDIQRLAKDFNAMTQS